MMTSSSEVTDESVQSIIEHRTQTIGLYRKLLKKSPRKLTEEIRGVSGVLYRISS